jgi:Domain of unknown function (DUF4157)
LVRLATALVGRWHDGGRLMQSHDEMEGAVRRRTAKNSQTSEPAADVGNAIANPKTASVQAMLEVQRLAGNAGVNQLLAREEDSDTAKSAPRSPVLDVVGKGGGQPLDTGLRGEMEGRLGADFSDVRLHTDAKATSSAKAVQANAYTVGSDVVVRNDRWSPGTDKGKETIAHELTHVVQQRAGPVAGSSTGDGIKVSDPSDSFERAAEKNATRVMAAPAPSSNASSSGGASAQLDGDDDVQRLVAQREAAPEEEEEAQAQREAAPEEEEEAQTQREAAPEEEEEAQTQREAAPEDEEEEAPAQMQRQAAPQDELETA